MPVSGSVAVVSLLGLLPVLVLGWATWEAIVVYEAARETAVTDLSCLSFLLLAYCMGVVSFSLTHICSPRVLLGKVVLARGRTSSRKV
jgi:hypothetical protein